MAKANLEGVPEIGSRWEVPDAWYLGGGQLTVTGFRKKGRGGYVLYTSDNGDGQIILSEFRSKAKAA